MDKKCLYCGSKRAKRKAGFIPYWNSRVKEKFYFCSEKCLSQVTSDSVEKCFDVERRMLRKAQISQERERKNALMQKDKLNNEDLGCLFSYLSAKQKKFLAVVGLSNMSWAVHGNPVQLIKKIDEGVNMFLSEGN